MATTQQPARPAEEEGTNLPTILGRTNIAALTDAEQRDLEQRRQKNISASIVTGLSWGKGLGVAERRAVADFCHRYGIDPVTEFDLLGSQPYINSDYFIRRLGELRQQGIIADAWLDHIEADPRLETLMMNTKVPDEYRRAAETEWYRRLFERVKHAAPDGAEGVCVCHIVLATGGHEVTGVKWGGGGTSVMQPKHGGGSSPNPVVEANAELSVESQCIRRAMRQVTSFIPAMRVIFEQMEGDLADLNERVIQPALAREAAQRDADARLGKGSPPIAGTAQDPYGLGKDDPRALTEGAAQPVAVIDMSKATDPYEPVPVRVSGVDASMSATATAATPEPEPLPPQEPVRTICPKCRADVSNDQPHKPECPKYAD